MIHLPYRITEQFEYDFLEIENSLIFTESIERTEKIIHSIFDKLNYINRNPYSFPATLQKDHLGNTLRKAVHFNTFIILYVIDGDLIEFNSIYHGKRNS